MRTGVAEQPLDGDAGAINGDKQWHDMDGQEDANQSMEDSPHDSLPPSPTGENAEGKSTAPTQKRRRVTRACDECRRKKIKCDGKQPCTHCTVYSYECTYDQPSNRRRNAAPQYVEALESQLKRANAMLKLIVPNADLKDPDLEAKLRQLSFSPTPFSPSPFSPSPLRTTATTVNGARTQVAPDEAVDDHLESMVRSTGQLDLDEQGHFEYHGHSSGLSFVRRMRESLGDVMMPEGKGTPFVVSRPMSQVFDSPRSLNDSPWDSVPPGADLPSREVARELCDLAINDAGALLRFVHYPTFVKGLEKIYDTAPEDYGNDENAFLPLLYSVLALGTLFSKKDEEELDTRGYEKAIHEGFKYFRLCRQLMDIADCRDLRQLQAVIFMILFLQSSAKLSTCYAYIGVALRSALRMGLHRCFTENFSPIEAETRKRVFWVIRKMDTYVGALLGLPHSLDDDDIDQEYPAEVDDEFITEEGIFPMPTGRISTMAAANAHTTLIQTLAKIVRYIYPVKASNKTTTDGKNMKSYSVSYAKIVEIEQDLQNWQENLPMALRPGGEAPRVIMRVQHLLRMAYAHAQMMLYRPFLHYVSQTRESQAVDKRSYACAAACVSVSRNIVHIAIEMKKRGLLGGAYWFTMYTTFFAILSLVFYALENPENEASRDVLKVAREGRDTLESLAKRSMAADRCTATLKALFDQVPENRLSRKTSVSSVRKRRQSPSPYANDTTTPQIHIKPDPETLGQTHLIPQDQQSMQIITSVPQPQPQPQPQPMDLGDLQYANAHGFFDLSTDFTVPNGTTPSLSSGYSQQQDSVFSASPQQNINDQQSFPLADLSAMMFPSADPFAYPNQPSGTDQTYDNLLKNLGNNPSFPFPAQLEALRMQRINGSSNGFVPPSSTFMFAATNGNEQHSPHDADVQLLGPMPMYLMQGGSSQQHQQQNQQIQHDFAGHANNNPSSSTPPTPSIANTMQQPRTQAATNKYFPNTGPPNMNLDQLLGGEEWAGLPTDRTGPGPNINAFVSPGPFTRRTVPGHGPGSVPATMNSAALGGDVSGVGGLTFDDLTPSQLGWGLEGF